MLPKLKSVPTPVDQVCYNRQGVAAQRAELYRVLAFLNSPDAAPMFEITRAEAIRDTLEWTLGLELTTPSRREA